MMVFEFCFLPLFLVFCNVRCVRSKEAHILAVSRFCDDWGGDDRWLENVWCKRPIFQKKKIFKKKKNKNFVSCVMVCDIIRFVLRHFSGFLSGFCVLCGKLLGLY